MNQYSKGLNQYKEQSVSTMTDIEMLTLLYNEALKHLNRAGVAVGMSEYDLFTQELMYTSDIIQYLSSTLDRSYPVSENLHSLYEFMSFEIARAKINRKVEGLEQIKPMLVELRDTFVEANKLAGKNKE